MTGIARANDLQSVDAAALRQQHKFSITQTTLDGALNELARQANVQVARFADESAITAHAVVGTYSLKQALELLLQGSSMTWRLVNERTIAIVSRDTSIPSAVVDPTTASAGSQADNDVSTRGSKMSHFNMLTRITALFGSLLAATSSTAVHAQTAGAESAPALEEIVITAQKRTEKLEDVPVSAAVVSLDTLATLNAGDVSDLNRLVPSVNMNGTINGRVPMGVRGISSVSNEQAVGVPSGVAILIDGVPVPSDSFAGNQIEDAQNIEVLKGPQATLGGRTAAAGVLNIVTHGPTDNWAGAVNLTLTDDKEVRANGLVSGPLTDSLKFSVFAYDAKRDFPVTNKYYNRKTDQSDNGVRGKLQLKVTDNFDVKLTVSHAYTESKGFNFVYLYLTPGATMFFQGSPITQSLVLPHITPSYSNLAYESPVNTAGHTHQDNNASLDLDFDLSGGYTLSSTTAYQYERQLQTQDLFATAVYAFDTMVSGSPVTSNPVIFNDTQRQKINVTQTSEEIRLVSPADQPLSFVTGLFYSNTKVDENLQRTLPPAAVNLEVIPETATYDIYGRATWKFRPATSLVMGLRYNYDQLKYDYNQVIYNGQGPWHSKGSSNSSALVGDVSLQQQLSDSSMGYVTFARGYSPKVYNTAATLFSNAEIDPVGQEHINHFEIGSKGTYLDRRLTANVSIFDTIYNNYQIQSYQNQLGLLSPPLELVAAGKAETRGVELDTVMQATNLLRVNFNAAYIDAKFVDFKDASCAPFDNTTSTPPANCSLKTGSTSTYVQDMSGQTMPNSPKFKFTLGAEQQIPVGQNELVLGGTYSYRSSAQMLPDNNPHAIQAAFGLLNLSVGLQNADNTWSLTAFVNNVTNHIYYADVEDFWSGPWSSTNAVIGQPARDAQRYGGVRFSAKF